MRQWVIRISWSIVLGAATTVAVAWALAWLNRVAIGNLTGAAVLPSGWHVLGYEETGVRHLSGSLTAWTGRNPEALEPLPSIFLQPPDEWLHTEYAERGWPFFALSCTGRSRPTSEYGPHDRVDWGIPIGGERALWEYGDFADAQLIALPLRPVWPGFAWNTLLYAAGWSLIAIVRSFVRRRIPRMSPRLAVAMAGLCLLLGMATTIVVAMCCAILIDESLDWSINRRFGTDGYTRNQSFGRWWLFEESTPGALRLTSSLFLGGGSSSGGPDCDADDICPSWAGFVRPPAEWLERAEGGGYVFGTRGNRAQAKVDYDTMDGWGRRVLEARGWPMLALWGGVRFRVIFPPGGGSAKYEPVETRYSLHEVKLRENGEYDWRASRIIPLMPTWPGFAVNALVLSTAWALVFLGLVGPRAVVRGRRISRGRCPLCGYDLRGRFAEGCPECGWNRDNAPATAGLALRSESTRSTIES